MAAETRIYKIQQKLDVGMLTMHPDTRTSSVIQETLLRFVQENQLVLGGTFGAIDVNGDSTGFIAGTNVSTWSATLLQNQANQTENITLTLPIVNGETIATQEYVDASIPDLSFTDGVLDGGYNTTTGEISLIPYAAAGAGHFSTTSAPVAGTTELSYSGYFHANALNSTGVLDVSGLSSLDGGLNVNSTFSVDPSTGSIITTGDVAINGGDITSSQATFNLLDVTPTKINMGGNAAIDLSKAGLATTVKGTLNVDQAATFDTTLGVTGNTTLTGDLAVNGGDITSSSNLNISDSAHTTTIKGLLNVDLATTLDTTLAVTGITTLTGLLNANGGIAVDGTNFTVSGSTGAIDTTSTLDVDALSSLDGGIDVNGSNFTVSTAGAIDTASTLTVDGLSSLDGGIDVNAGNFTVATNGNIVAVGDLALNGGDITSTSTTFNIGAANVTTMSLGNAATSVVIPGNITIEGTATTIDSTTVQISDRILELAKDNTSALTGYAGLVITKYDGTNDGGILIDHNGEFRVGDVTINGANVDNVSTVPLLARAETGVLDNNDLMVWETSTLKAVGKTLSELGIATSASISNDTITLTAGTDLITGGNFTLNGSTKTITFNHATIAKTTPTSTLSPNAGATFTAIDSMTVSGTGHVTNVNTKTITLPTYGISADTATNGAEINLTASGGTSSLVEIIGSNGTSVTKTDADTITLSSTVVNSPLITVENGLGLNGLDQTFNLNQAGAQTINLELGTPGTLSSSTTDTVTADSHTHAITNYALNGTASSITVTGAAKVLGSAGTISLTAAYGDSVNPYASKTANYVLAAPNGSAGAPVFRAFNNVDLPETFNDTPAVYTAVNVNSKGIVTDGAFSMEVGTAAHTTPSSDLIIGGIFFLDKAATVA